jgi:HEAT repeat protein
MVARRAAEALANIGTPDALAALTVPLTETEMTPSRHAAMTGLEAAGEKSTKTLVSALSSDDSALRANAAEMLGYIKPAAAVEPLAAALQDPEPEVRGQAAWALGEIASPEARNVLAPASRPGNRRRNQDCNVQSAAAEEDQSFASQTQCLVMDSRTLSHLPATNWTFLALFMALAVAVLLTMPHAQTVRRRR